MASLKISQYFIKEYVHEKILQEPQKRNLKEKIENPKESKLTSCYAPPSEPINRYLLLIAHDDPPLIINSDTLHRIPYS